MNDSDMSTNSGGLPLGPVMVALGATGGDSAIALGVRVARVSGVELQLVHIVEPVIGIPEVAILAEFDVENAAAQLMRTAVERVRAAEPDLRVSGSVLVGNAVSALVKNTTEAMVVVMEHRDLSRLARFVVRSVSGSVAVRARVPVVSVPEGWQSRPEAPVTVAVDEPATAANLVRAAALAASSLGVDLRVLNVWQLPMGYEGVQLSEEDDATLAARSSAEIQQLLASVADALTDLKVSVTIERGHPAEALLEASKTSAVLVLGRHDPSRGRGSHVGPVARRLVRSAHSPVMLVDLGD